MKNYICNSCKKHFDSPSKLERHNNRKIPCKSVEDQKKQREATNSNEKQREATRSNEKQREATRSNGQDIGNNLREKTPNGKKYIKMVKELYKCEYCETKIKYKRYYKKHLRDVCLKIPKDEKKKLIEKFNNNKRHLNTLEILDNPNVINNLNDGNIKHITNNIQTTNNTKTTNNTQTTNNTLNSNIINNYQVKINPVGQEDISSLSTEKIIEYLSSGYPGYCRFLSAIYKIDENKNIFIRSRRENMVQFINADYELEIGNMDEVISDITVGYYNKFDNLFEEHQNSLTTKNKSRFETVSKLFTDKQDKFERQTYLCLVNATEIHKDYINKFLRIKNENGDEQVLIGRVS